MPADKIRWGILGTGSIARQFAAGLTYLPDAAIVAVGSRTAESAEAFGAMFKIPRRHASYEALANDPAVDVIYISTPHPMHYPNAKLCLEAGKAVLCEKPFTLNARQTADLIRLAREKRLFLMEAMWTRYIPAVARARQMIGEGALGEIWMLAADFGFRAAFNPHSRLFNPDLGGGALLDVGIYPVSLASWLFGPPAHIQSMAYLGATGVDEQSSMQFRYQGCQLALLSCAVSVRTRMEATIAGTEGYLYLHSPWWRAARFTLSRPDQPDEVFDIPYEGNGYNYEAAEVGRCLRAGLLESPTMPLDETLSIMQTLDAVRAQWGLVYPGE